MHIFYLQFVAQVPASNYDCFLSLLAQHGHYTVDEETADIIKFRMFDILPGIVTFLIDQHKED